MKKIIIGIFYFCIVNLNVWSIDVPKEDDAKKVIHLLREVEERVSAVHEEGTIFLGNTSAGKSTLFNYLQRIPLHGRKKGFGEYEIVLVSDVEEETYSPIGLLNTVSQTTLPKVIGNNFDAPGFQDTRDFQDIVNAYSIYRIVNHTRNLRIVLVSTFEEIRSTRGNHFFNLLDQVGEIFRDNMDTLCQSLCFVVTKVNGQQINKKEYKGLFAAMLQEQLGTGLGNESPRIKILSFLSERNDRIEFFRMPEEEGLISDKDRCAIQTMLATTPYQVKIRPTLSLSAKSRLIVNDLITGIFDEMRSVISDLSKRYPELYENFIQSNLNKKASQIREKLDKISVQLRDVSGLPNNFYENAIAIESVLKRLGHKDRGVFREYQQRLSFFTEIGLKEEIDREIERYRLFSTLEQFKRDAEGFVKIEQRDNNSVLNGFLLGISDLNKLLRENALSEVELHSLNTLLIDEDLTEPGLNLTLIAPRWRVIGNKTLSLKGCDGLAHNNGRARDGDASSSNGQDGVPGKPGESGGHFYGWGKIFHGLEYLTIDTSGGKGGTGQDGGHGHRGEDGDLTQQFSHEKMIEEALPTFRERRWRRMYNSTPSDIMANAFKLGLTLNRQFKENYYYYWKGKKGGHAGKKGAGGEGGKGGSIILDNDNIINLFQLNENDGESGDAGSSGSPGKGGITFVKKKTYINERMFETSYLGDRNGPVIVKIAGIFALPFLGPIALVASPISKLASSHWENDGALMDCPDEYEDDGLVITEANSENIVFSKPRSSINTEQKKDYHDIYYRIHSQNKLTIPL